LKIRVYQSEVSRHLKGVADVPSKHFAHRGYARVPQQRNPTVEEAFRVLSYVNVAAATAQDIGMLCKMNAPTVQQITNG